MAINGVGHNYDYFGTTTNYIRGKANIVTPINKTSSGQQKYQKI